MQDAKEHETLILLVTKLGPNNDDDCIDYIKDTDDYVLINITQTVQ